MSRRDSFQQSKATAFIESPALERDVESPRLFNMGVSGNGLVHTDVRERAYHATLNHIHTQLVDGDVILGIRGSTGTYAIGGSGWVRITLRVKAVACRIPVPTTPIEKYETEGHLHRLGAVMWLRGAGVYSELQPSVRMNTLPDLNVPGLNPYITVAFKPVEGIGLNFFEEETEYSETPHVMDRIIRFSARCPVFLSGGVMEGWTRFAPTGGLGMLFTGGTTDPLVDYSGAALGTAIGGSGGDTVCRNPGINTTRLRPPYGPMFTNPLNTVNAEAMVVGWRPAAGPERERYTELN